MSTGPAESYAAISRVVAQLVRVHQTGNDPTLAAYQTMRAAALIIRESRGAATASGKARELAEELGAEVPR